MPGALPVVGDCNASCECTTTVNVTQLIQDAIDEAVAETVAAQTKEVFQGVVDLRTDTGYVNEKWVLLPFLNSPGDGQGGQYIFDSTSLAVDDGISVIKLDAIDAADPGRYLKVI